MIESFWKEAPRFLSRTNTQYCRVPIKDILIDRGLENSTLTAFVDNLPEGAYIAGGFLLSILLGKEHDSDIDIFFNSPLAFEKTMMMFDMAHTGTGHAPLKDYIPVHKLVEVQDKGGTMRYVRLKNANAKRPPVQLIKLVWYDNAEHVIDSFDLTVAQFATDGHDLIFNPLSIMDLMRKRIVLHRIQFPSSTIRRIAKYAKKGFLACPGSLVHFTQEITKIMNDGNPDEISGIVYID